MSNEQTDRSELTPAVGALAQLARQSLGNMTPEQCLRGELALASGPSVARPAWLVPSAVTLVAGIALASAIALRHHAKMGPSELSYVIENGSSPEDRSLDVDSGPPRMVRFSDGTEVRVDQGTQARIRFVTNHGAELAMSRGALHAAVIHSATSEWRFDAGPFVVHVTGTAFGLAWDPDADRFDLRLEHGSVTVSSPVVSDPIPVRAGQWLTIRPRSNEVFIRDLVERTPNDEPHDTERAAEPTTTDREPSPATPGSADSASSVKAALGPGHTWAEELAHGKVDQIVDDALRLGLDNCLARSSSSDLAALADAARYTRRDDVARKVLLAERHRFAGSRTATDAGMLLGRLAEAEQNDSQALSWFDTYLAEAPGGVYASEALGRKMAVVRHSVGAAAARAVAQEYLGKYPNGTYSSAARAILKSP
jgi:FecR protein